MFLALREHSHWKKRKEKLYHFGVVVDDVVVTF